MSAPPSSGPAHGRKAARRHGHVFAAGGTAMAAVVLAAAGFTWASQDGDGSGAELTASPSASAAAAAQAKAGECGMVLDGKPRAVPLATARAVTMVAAVGQQVRAPDVQTARAIDAALAEQAAAAAAKSAPQARKAEPARKAEQSKKSAPARKPQAAKAQEPAPEQAQPKVTWALGLLARAYENPASPDAEGHLRALTTPGGLTCAFTEPKIKNEKAGDNVLTPRASRLRTSVLDAFGKLSTTGYDRPGVTDAKPADPAARDGRAFDVALSPVTEASRTRGWALAHWLVAAAGEHGVATVTYDGWTWSAKAGSGWRPLPAPLSLPEPPLEPPPAPAPSAAPAPTAAEVARSVAAQYLDRLHVTVATGR